MQTKTFAIPLFASLLAAAPVFANVSVGDRLGTDDAQILTALEAQGYQVEEIEREDGEIEAEVMKDGVEYELTLAQDTGEILEIETDSDDGDDD